MHIFPTFAVGGSQVRFAELVHWYGKRYRHTVVALDGNIGMKGLMPASAPVTVEKSPPTKLPLLAGVREAARSIRQHCPDVLVTYNWGSMHWWLASKLSRGLRHIHIEDGFGPEEQTTQLRRRVLARRFALVDEKTTVVLPSNTLVDIATRIWRLPKRSLQYIPNSIEVDRFSVPVRRRCGQEVVIGTVATLRPEKNLGRLIRIFESTAKASKLPLRLIIVGGGAEFDNLKALAAKSEFADQITLAGPTRSPETFLREMDIFALTSNTEQMPLSVLEAMAASLPVVSFDVGDVAEMVSSENKRFASLDPSDDKRFIRSLIELSTSAEMRATLGTKNRLAVETKFDVGPMVRAYAALFD